MQALRRDRNGSLTWDFRGEYLVLKDVELDYLAACDLSDALARR